MSKICQISGKKVQFGNNVSKSINKTKRRFKANIVSKKFYIHPVHLALAFCTQRPFMGSVIFGATTDEQLDVVIKGLDIDLSDEVMEEISLVYKNYPLTF